MSEVLKEMKERRSIRKYKADMVPQEILDQIIEAGLYAASGKGTQNTIIIQVTKKELRDEIDKALQNNLPVIVSEWGTTDASGNGSVDIEESKKWIEYLNSKKISHINWSFSNKNESSAIIRQDYLENPDNNDTSNNEDNLKNDFNDYLTESGKFVKSIFN